MFGLTFSRWYLFGAAFVVQFCIGCIYAWSVLNHPIDLAVYGDAKKGRAVNAFYIAIGVFGAATSTMGPTIERKGPRWGVFIGTAMYMIGHIVTALGCHYKSIAVIYIGYGVITAIGMGMCYISPVSTLQKWFPDYRGTAAGFAVAGYGAGSVVWSKVYLPTIDAVGLSWMFVLLGAIMSAAMFTSALVLRVPPPGFTVNGLDIHGDHVDENDALEDKLDDTYKAVQTPTGQDAVNSEGIARSKIKQLTLKQAIFTPDYVFMYIMFFANQLFGVIVLSRLSSMCTDIFNKSAGTASDIVSVNSAFNCCGRLAFPAMSDFLVRYLKIEKTFARKVLYYFTLGAQVVVLGSLPTVIRHDSYTVFVIEIFVLTCSYGGGFGTIPAFVTEMFGAYNIGPMHGIILTAMAIGGVAGGLSFNHAYNNKIADGMSVGEAYIDNIQVIFVIVCIGFVVLFLVRTNVEDRFEPGYHYSVCGKRVISIPPKEKDAMKQQEAEAEAADKLPETAV
ncbi:Major Facilitator Superfamily (MFS) [Phytophthora palmivora]|uniref:Major Facilitator Superfamily (MFS) n=1 Tax=Phytophthora palmivora TaxID=4796 RepID=A0A2P4WX72_9STRA|nr:Major Facilitator Superfamily (MFS) [Phytophthora palmivora]